MKKMIRLIVCTVLTTVLMAQTASAVLVTNMVRNTKGIGVGIVYATPTFSRSYDWTRLQPCPAS